MMENLLIKQLDISALSDVLTLQEEAFACLENTEMLRRNSTEMLSQCLDEPHYALGAFEGGRLVAIAILYVADQMGEEDLGHLLSDPELRNRRCGNFKLCIVHPRYRGRGLQQTMGRLLAAESRKRGIEVLCSTVHPDNLASIRSLEKIGYRSDGLRDKYGSVRMLFFCDLLDDSQ